MQSLFFVRIKSASLSSPKSVNLNKPYQCQAEDQWAFFRLCCACLSSVFAPKRVSVKGPSLNNKIVRGLTFASASFCAPI